MNRFLAVRRLNSFTLCLVGLLAGPASAVCGGDLRVAPLWNGETSFNPDKSLVLNRFGGPPVHLGDTQTEVTRTDAPVHSGKGAYEIAIDVGDPLLDDFGFFQLSLGGFGPSSEYVAPRDLARFATLSFWVKNEIGAPIPLTIEVKDYRDENNNRAYRSLTLPDETDWFEVSIPLDLSDGWTVVGGPDLSRAKLIGFVIETLAGDSLSGSFFIDDMQLAEPGRPVDLDRAKVDTLAATVARRQFEGLWGVRNRAHGFLPAISTFADWGALNVTAGVVQTLPCAVEQGWVLADEANDYVTLLVETLNQLLDEAEYLPPRYVDLVTLEPFGDNPEESPIDAAFMYLALYQYQRLETTPLELQAAIASVLARFDFAAFASEAGWKLAYLSNTGEFTEGTYDGYSGEIWTISLAAHLSTTHHVEITELYHSGVFRVKDFLVNETRAHMVHTLTEFRAPFLQWLFSLFVDVSDRGPDSYPDAELATNPFDNAVLYQTEVHDKLAARGRSLYLQADASDDGSGEVYEQFSCYNDFGQPDLYMPWSVAFGFLVDPETAGESLRFALENGLHGPLGLADSVVWPLDEECPTQHTLRHDFWNLSLSTMAFFRYLYPECDYLTGLPEVDEALDQVFPASCPLVLAVNRFGGDLRLPRAIERRLPDLGPLGMSGDRAGAVLLAEVRRFRDEALGRFAAGRTLVELYDAHRGELRQILNRRPELGRRTLALVADLLPALQAAGDRPGVTITAEQYRRGQRLIADFAADAGPRLRQALARLRRLLRERSRIEGEEVVLRLDS